MEHSQRICDSLAGIVFPYMLPMNPVVPGYSNRVGPADKIGVENSRRTCALDQQFKVPTVSELTRLERA
jgi:hypothetical protein